MQADTTTIVMLRAHVVPLLLPFHLRMHPLPQQAGPLGVTDVCRDRLFVSALSPSGYRVFFTVSILFLNLTTCKYVRT